MSNATAVTGPVMRVKPGGSEWHWNWTFQQLNFVTANLLQVRFACQSESRYSLVPSRLKITDRKLIRGRLNFLGRVGSCDRQEASPATFIYLLPWSSILLNLLVLYLLADYLLRCKLTCLWLLSHTDASNNRLSGFVVIQIVVYFKLYFEDPRSFKTMVRHQQLFI